MTSLEKVSLPGSMEAQTNSDFGPKRNPTTLEIRIVFTHLALARVMRGTTQIVQRVTTTRARKVTLGTLHKRDGNGDSGKREKALPKSTVSSHYHLCLFIYFVRIECLPSFFLEEKLHVTSQRFPVNEKRKNRKSVSRAGRWNFQLDFRYSRFYLLCILQGQTGKCQGLVVEIQLFIAGI